jgi:uncharacterized protein YxeA
MGEVISKLVLTLIIGFILTIILGGYFLFDIFSIDKIESKVKLKPEYRLETDGQKIDTIWIYKKQEQ